jgi:hypothetical protein
MCEFAVLVNTKVIFFFFNEAGALRLSSSIHHHQAEVGCSFHSGH